MATQISSRSAAATRTNNFAIKIANVNGSGSASANSLIHKSIFRSGVPVSAKNIFPSNIQGLPTWFEIRVNRDGHVSRSPSVDLVVAMNPQTMAEDMRSVRSGGYFLFDSTWPLDDEMVREDVGLLSVPLTALSVEAFPNVKTRLLMKNITYVGAVAAFLNIELDILKQLLDETYSRKPQLADANMRAITLSYEFVRNNFSCPLPISVERMDRTENQILINGNTACALGCLYAGATVAAWYPITPATSVTDSFRQLCARYRRDPETGMMNAAVVQAEDELAAAGMAIGAGWAGARAFTPTSGAGISLMSEFIGFAYFTEIPVVIFDIQRVGPSTGMPTRTQQGDILMAAYASHGDTKHIVLLPGNPEECFYLSVNAFDLAERYQTPVLVLSDLDIGMNEWISKRLQWDDSYQPDRGKVLGAAELEDVKDYSRYLDVDGDGIPRRTVPGVHPNGAYFLRGSGHNKHGKYTEQSDEYEEVVDRLLRKVSASAGSLPPAVIEYDVGNGGGKPRSARSGVNTAVITVGSCDLAVREALEMLATDGLRFDYMRVRSFPFATDVEEFLAAHDTCYVIEQNRDGQLRSLLVLETGCRKENLISVTSYGGMPMDAQAVLKKLKAAMKSGGQA
jgi:2-oxoglutarate ferredoxin oxidoreductase subunit alpha